MKRSAVRSDSAMIVTAGLAASALGKMEMSQNSFRFRVRSEAGKPKKEKIAT